MRAVRRRRKATRSRILTANGGVGSSIVEQVGDLGPHQQTEIGIGLCVTGKKIEKIPLRHQRDKFAACQQAAEIRDSDPDSANESGEFGQFLMRSLQEFFQQAEFVRITSRVEG